MKIFEFLQGENGIFSSTRLFMLLVCLSCIVDWQHAVWTVGKWSPELDVLMFIGAVLGIKVWEKKNEQNSSNNTNSN